MLVDKEIALERARICASCDKFFKPTFTCKECYCFLKLKVKLEGSSCPLHKWGTIEAETTADPSTYPVPEEQN